MLGTILYPYILIYNILMFLLVSYSLKSSSCSCNSISISSHFCPQSVIFSIAIICRVGSPITNDLRVEKRTLSSLPNIGWSLGCAGIDPWIVLTLRIISHRVGSVRSVHALHTQFQCVGQYIYVVRLCIGIVCVCAHKSFVCKHT